MYQWVRNFSVNQDDVEYLTNLLLELETPMTSTELAIELVKRRIQAQQEAFEAQFQDTIVYDPSQKYEVGQRLLFTQFDRTTAEVVAVRTGDNSDFGEFDVIRVRFDESKQNDSPSEREFAASLQHPHSLNGAADSITATNGENYSPMDILRETRGSIVRTVHMALVDNPVLTRVGGYWFPRELVMDVDIGTLHLAEAVLDMAQGGPLGTEEIISQIGPIGDAPMTLQTFSLNLAMSKDERFDEVGPGGEILWYLVRMEPDGVRQVPAWLRYNEIPYNDDLITDEMLDLETELDDELTEIDFEGKLKRSITTLIYPHRRAGTLPLNAKNRQIFPQGRAQRIYVSLVDGLDGTTFNGWVVHEHKYVYGLLDYYTKHRLPIGARLTIENGEEDGSVIITHDAYRPRTEYIRVFVPSETQITFENKKRAIGTEYDDLMVIGIDDLAKLDKLVEANKNKTLVTLLRSLLIELGKLTPQGTTHAVTLYSALNVLRRCPPGAVFAMLQANPEFEHVGNHYWKLSENE